MISRKPFITTLFFLTVFIVYGSKLFAASESYVQTLTGKIKKGDSLLVVDDKFLNQSLENWNKLKNVSVNDIITFELRQDTAFFYRKKPFSCTISITVQYYTSRDQQTPDQKDDINLTVRYDTAKGKSYPISSQYKFKSAYRVLIIVKSITSPEWKDKLPSIFRLKSQILVERKYPFDPKTKGSLHIGKIRNGILDSLAGIVASGPNASNSTVLPLFSGLQPNGTHLPISWNPNDFGNPDTYDIEWTFIDGASARGVAIYNSATSSGFYDPGSSNMNIPQNLEESWLLHDATRVTVSATPYSAAPYLINLPYENGFVLVRIRGVSYDPVTNVRMEGEWSYTDDNSNTTGCPVYCLSSTINWQYSGAFAEEGKRKEVISYFDGTMRSRQSVTINNSDLTFQDPTSVDPSPTAIVQETIYDIMGRPFASILPAPVKNNSLDYIYGVNQNQSGVNYSYADVNLETANGNSCTIVAGSLSNSTGASQYYSPFNSFLDKQNFGQYYFTNYVPDAGSVPLAVTEYTPDNTGRIRRQGGVGPTFQIGSGHETQYFYGKPHQSELDRLFGSEVGSASHYLKNMIIDPNGQISISYIDANSKTIATGLAGLPPGNVDALPSSSAPGSSVPFNEPIISSTDFRANTEGLHMDAYTTFMADQTGSFTLNYNVSPLALVTNFGLNGASQLCNNCYYTLNINVTNDCGATIASSNTAPFQGNDLTCYVNPPVYTNSLSLPINKVGEYTVMYSLQLSEDVISYQTNNYVQNNTDLSTLKTFFLQELIAADFSGCYSTCDACKTLGSSSADFIQNIQTTLAGSQFAGISATDPDISAQLQLLWQQLKSNCSLLNCAPPSPCEQKLTLMEQDVMPGGQYALYDQSAIDNNTTPVFLELPVNVLVYYTTDPAIASLTFTDATGTTQVVGNLSNAAFIQAYLAHPEWAALFVVHHIEYCSYQWCKDQSNPSPTVNNEVSYTFDQSLRQNYTVGSDAVAAGYYNHSDPLALLNLDPFFNGGRGSGYKTNMAQDLQSFSTVSNFILYDGNSLVQPAKNIIDLVDWMLYCKPADPNTPLAVIVSSWNNCSVSDNCRSVTMEWQLYRNYYLQLKSKYLQIEKQVYNPSCVNCFVGNDGLTSSPSVVTIKGPNNSADFSMETLVSYNSTQGDAYSDDLIASSWTCEAQGFPSCNFRSLFKFNLTTIPVNAVLLSAKLYLYANTNSVNGYNGTPTYGSSNAGWLRNVILPWVPGQTGWGYQPVAPSYNQIAVPQSSGTAQNYVIDVTPFAQSWISNPSSNNGMLFELQNESPYNSLIFYSGTAPDNLKPALQLTFQQPPGPSSTGSLLAAMFSNCNSSSNDNPPWPVSTCITDPNYALYQNKTRVWNDYVNIMGYINCMAGVGSNSGIDVSDAYNGALNDLAAQKQNWLEQLRGVVSQENASDDNNGVAERFGALADITNTDGTITINPTVQDLVNALYNIGLQNINFRKGIVDAELPAGNTAYNDFDFNQLTSDIALIRASSNLPGGALSPDGYNSFLDAFNDLAGNNLVQLGFGPDLLNNPYPYNETPVQADPNVSSISANICANVSALNSQWTAAGSQGSFSAYLQAQLGDDYNLTPDQLSDIQNRCSYNCSPQTYLANPANLPVSFVLPPPSASNQPGTVTAYLTCQFINDAVAAFNVQYPNVTTGTQLYRLVFTNFLNHYFGYELSFADYNTFLNGANGCLINPSAFLYDKPETPTIANNDYACAESMVSGLFVKSGQEYDVYINNVRNTFRNAYISKCLSNTAGASLQGNQYQYHFTLYYYDQSENLVKTIPPEGVRMLSDVQLQQVSDSRNISQTSCSSDGAGVITDQNTILNNFSSYLQDNSAQALEIWLYNNVNQVPFQFRVNTPDNKYMLQGAVSNNKLWIELYALSPNQTGDFTINYSNSVVADISGLPPLQQWIHLVVQSPDGLATGQFQLYLDGNLLSLMPAATAAPFPFDWSITGGFALPAMDVSLFKQFRVYNSTLTSNQVLADYQNTCLAPDNSVARDLELWGRLNIPSPGSPTTTGPGSTNEYNIPFIVPNHGLASTYAYNSLNQVVSQNTPDGGMSVFLYDVLGRLVVSQNAEQLASSNGDASNRFSYTNYDALGRINEVGEKLGAATLAETDSRTPSILSSWYGSGSNRLVTVTAYDEQPAWAPASLVLGNLRKRVAATALLSSGSDPAANRTAASYYNYDIDGNVSELVQENQQLIASEQQVITGTDGLKHIKYDYDLISGKVNMVSYQDGKWDEFYYQYSYDADNRIVQALTSRDKLTWNLEANYRYYLHGPLARMELGNYQVQGLDYAYTLQGWLKGVNGQYLLGNSKLITDMGGDGIAGTNFSNFGRDAYAYSLGYYQNDYTPIGGSFTSAFGLQYQKINFDQQSGNDLFNGNISNATYAINPLENNNTVGYTYKYDQLNRLTAMDKHTIIQGQTTWDNTSIIQDYAERVSYDANGNIKTYSRNGTTANGSPLAMDNLTYNYNLDGNGQLLNNKLQNVNDAVPASNYSADIDDQQAGNYVYDNIGNLISDATTGTMKWTVYGKISEVDKLNPSGTYIRYSYDASGNRISKTAGSPSGTAQSTYYLRDAQGNVLSVYTYDGQGNGTWAEQHLYGSSRLGMVTPNVNLPISSPLSSDAYVAETDQVNNSGNRQYELTNHLGNVMATISDQLNYVANASGSFDHYDPTILSAQDYYPGGMELPGRTYTSGNNSYRYGFNGKELDKETSSTTTYDYGFRIYSPALGRFLSVDPLTKSYPWYTPYQFAGNTPIQAIDLDGLEELKSIYFKNVRFVLLENVTFDFVIRKSTNTLTTEMMGKDATGKTEYSVNLQMYEPKPGTNPDYYTATKPQDNYRSQGLNNAGGKTVEGRSSPSTFFFSIGNNGAVTAGMGDAPLESKVSFGGGVPLYVNGLKYGEENIWKPGTPAEVAKNTIGAVAPENTKYLLQKSNSAYPKQNDVEVGKTILAYNSKQNIWLIASQENGTEGMTLDRLRDKLVNEGWDQILSFDGSSSATLVKDKQILTKPANYKNNTAPSGLRLSVPNK